MEKLSADIGAAKQLLLVHLNADNGMKVLQVSLLSTENELSAVECTESSGAVTRGNTTTMALRSLPVGKSST